MKELTEMTSQELKDVAKALKVTNWWSLSKAALIESITEKQDLLEALDRHDTIYFKDTSTEENYISDARDMKFKNMQLIYDIAEERYKLFGDKVNDPELAGCILRVFNSDEEITEYIKANNLKVDHVESVGVTEEFENTEAPEPMKMSDTIKTLETIFDKLNEIYYENSLPKAVITIQSTPKAYGHCSTKKIWKAEEEETAMYEINIGAEFINRPIAETAATLQHEMVHLYCLVNNISDTCQNGRYHNGTFKEEGEKRGLLLEYDRTNGWTHTKPSPEFINNLTEAGIDMTIRFARVLSNRKGTRRERNKQHKYVCPVCGQAVKTTADLNIICGDCHETMERV